MADRDNAPDIVVSGDPDESVPRRRRPWTSLLALAVTFVAGLGVGHQWPSPTTDVPTPAASRTGQDRTAWLRHTGQRCAVPTGTRLWLGIELINEGPGPAVLREANLRLPLAGLAPVAVGWGTCGQRAGTGDTPELAPGASIWVATLVDVLIDCPAPVPVLFRVAWTDPAGSLAELVVGFPDLGDLPYPGCPATPG